MTALKDKRILIPGAVVALLLIGIAIPKLTVHDTVPADADRSCIDSSIQSQRENSLLKRLFFATGAFQITQAERGSGEAQFYTLFRIPFGGKMHTICDYAVNNPDPLPLTDGTNVDGFGQFRDSSIKDGSKSFTSGQYGISFTYPSNYFVFDARSANADGENYGIGVIPDSSFLREAVANAHNEPGMIPRISIFFYHDDSNASLEEIARKRIIRANGESAPIPTFNKTTVGGVPAIRHIDTSGLYQRDTVLLRHGDWMVQIAADDSTYFKTDLDSVLSSTTFH